MLRISQQSHAAAAKSYYATADYYAEGQEIVGHWGGKAAAMLGLSGQVDKPSFDHLCENRHPQTRQRLTARTKDNRTVGYDFTWSAPKSVSLLYGLTKDERILDAFRRAVDETMADIETEMKARVRKGKADADRVTGNAAWASFYHFTSRPVDDVPDPQLHAHCFTFNTTWDSAEKRWKAGQFRDLKRDAPYWQASMRNRFAKGLKDLGFVLERKRDDFEIAGVSNEVLAKFSRRTAAIEELAAKKGITDPEQKAELGAKSRESKNLSLTWPELQMAWRERLTADESVAVASAYRHRRISSQPGREAEAIDLAIGHVFERDSIAPERTVLTEALKFGLGDVDQTKLAEELHRRKLIADSAADRKLLTTREVLSEEKRIVAFAKEGRGRYAPLVGYDQPLKREWLNAEQQRAVRHLWESPDRVMLLRGAAGTGKTTLLQEAVEGIEASGRHVTLLAPSAKASRGVLREAGFKNADTVARFLQDKAMQTEARGNVILIDEASLVGTRTLARVFDVAESLDCRVILVGDDKQHSAVERGAAFRLLQEHAAVPVAEVTDIRRQKGKYRDAVKALSEGRVLDGFDQLERLGWVKELPRDQRDDALAAEYVRVTSGQSRETALVVSPTHAEGARVTAAIRDRLKAKKLLKDERTLSVWTPSNLTEAERSNASNVAPGDMLQFHQHVPGHRSGSRLIVQEGVSIPGAYAGRFQHFRPRELKVAVGDRLRVTVNGKTKDGKHRLNNGDLFTVTSFTPSGDIVVNNGWVLGKDFGHLTHGYVETSHSSQGRTVDRVLIAQSGESFKASSREQFYVSASRAKKSATVYTDSSADLRAAIQRSDPNRLALDMIRDKRRRLGDRVQKHLEKLRRLAISDRDHARHPAAHRVREVKEFARE